MGTARFLLALFFYNAFIAARPFYDDADENNAKFLEAILYEKTDTMKAAIALLSQLNLPLLCQSVASDPHAQFATVADLLHFATVVVQAQENITASVDPLADFTTTQSTLPFDKITSVYPKAVTETVTMAAENSMEMTFPKKNNEYNEFKSVEELKHEDKANGKLLSKQTVVIKSVDSIGGENGLESASRLMKNKTKGSGRSKELKSEPDFDKEESKSTPTTSGITRASRNMSSSTDRHTYTTSNARSTQPSTRPTTTAVLLSTQTSTAILDGDSNIIVKEVTQRGKTPRNPYLDRSDQKPSFPTSVLSDLGTTTPLHWLIRDKWPEMEQQTQELLKERQIISEELSREVVSGNGNETLTNSTDNLAENVTLDKNTSTTLSSSTTPQNTPTAKPDTTSHPSTTKKPDTTTSQQTSSTPRKTTTFTANFTNEATTTTTTKQSVSQPTKLIKRTKDIRNLNVSKPTPTPTISTKASSTTTDTHDLPNVTDSTTLTSSQKISNITKSTTAQAFSTSAQTKNTRTTSKPSIASTTMNSLLNTTTTSGATSTPKLVDITKTTTPQTTANPKLSDKKSTFVNITRILDMTKTTTAIIRSSSPKVNVTIKPILNTTQFTIGKKTLVTSKPRAQKHVTLNRGLPTTVSPTVTEPNITNITETTTPKTMTTAHKTVSTQSVTKSSVSSTSTTTTPQTSTKTPAITRSTSLKHTLNTTLPDKITTTPTTTSTKLPPSTTGKVVSSTKQKGTTTTEATKSTVGFKKLSTVKKQDTIFETKAVNNDIKQKPALREKIVPVENSRDSERTDVRDYGNEITQEKSSDRNYIAPGQTDDNFGFFTCPTIFGFYPDAINCGQFYICSWSIPYHFDCPVGTVWNTELTVCDWPFNVNCGTRPWFGRRAFEKHFLPRQL